MLLPVTVGGGGAAEKTYTVLAGRSASTGGGGGASASGHMKVLISSQVSSSSSVSLTVTGLPSSSSWRWSASVIDGAHPHSATVAGAVASAVGGALSIEFSLAPPAVALLRMRDGTARAWLRKMNLVIDVEGRERVRRSAVLAALEPRRSGEPGKAPSSMAVGAVPRRRYRPSDAF